MPGVEMSELEAVKDELPVGDAGAQLKRARQAAGLSQAEVCAILRLPERHLVAIESGDYSAFPARTYAIGFSRSYAKVVGLDPEAIAAAVRVDLNGRQPEEEGRPVQTFEPGDPARVPGSGMIWLAALGMVVVLIAVFIFARPMISPAEELPSIIETPAPAPAMVASAPAVAPAPAPAPAAGVVVFTATDAKVWVKFTDGTGKELMQKELVQGESWTIPAGQPDVRLTTGRPDALAITVDGKPVPGLAEQQKLIKDIPVSAAALLQRSANPAPPPAAGSTPAAT